jgi:hypothetical protein
VGRSACRKWRKFLIFFIYFNYTTVLKFISFDHQAPWPTTLESNRCGPRR